MLKAAVFSLLLPALSFAQVELGRKPKGRPWLGLLAADAVTVGKELGYSGEGALVLAVREGSPAAQAGVEAGDVIVELAGQGVPNREMLEGTLAYLEPEAQVRLKLKRAGRTLTVEAALSGSAGTGPYLQPETGRAPRVWTVAPDGTGDFRTLTAALVRARYGDTITLKAGRYPGAVLFRDGIRIGGDAASVTIEGLDGRAGPRDLVLEGLTVEAGGEKSAVDLVRASNVTLEHVRLSRSLWGLSADDSSVAVRGSVLEKNGGGLAARRSTVDVRSSWIVDNLPSGGAESRGAAAGVLVDSSSVSLFRTTIANSRRPSGDYYGIALENGSRLLMERCLVSGHRAWLNVLPSEDPGDLRKLADRVDAAAEYARHPDAAVLSASDKQRFLAFAAMSERELLQLYAHSLREETARAELEALIGRWEEKAVEMRRAADLRESRALQVRIEDSVFFDNDKPPLKGLPKSDRSLDPLFMNGALGDFRLSPESPLWRGGDAAAGAPHLKPERKG